MASFTDEEEDLQFALKQINSLPMGVTDPEWEIIDPTPDVHALFKQFNETYFFSKLDRVVIDWSKQMTSCAGVTGFQVNNFSCRINLSAPLLTLRPRKDLVETLLHEMIHAYIFLTSDYEKDGSHGPLFHEHMYRINAQAGCNITVYHDFIDEVNSCKVHVWKCDGPCRLRPPYWGTLRRAKNRAPGPNDQWWAQHQMNCGGKYIKQPLEAPILKTKGKPKAKPYKKQNKENDQNDIRKFFIPIGSKSETEADPKHEKQDDDLKLTDDERALVFGDIIKEGETSVKHGNVLGSKGSVGAVTHGARPHVIDSYGRINGISVGRMKHEGVAVPTSTVTSGALLETCGPNGGSSSAANIMSGASSDSTENAANDESGDNVMNGNFPPFPDNSNTIDLTGQPNMVQCYYCRFNVEEFFYSEHVEQDCVAILRDSNMWRIYDNSPAINYPPHVRCPICTSMVTSDNINEHIDSGCVTP